jgi:8-oxo-dGTP pyrophosphatase MutT (NUDIX family)
VATYSEIREVRRRLADLYPVPAARDLLAVAVSSAYRDFERIHVPPLGLALTSDAVNALLAEAPDLEVRVADEPYRPPRRVSWAHDLVLAEARRRGRRDFNDPKVRLTSDLLPGVQWTRVEVQRTRFLYAAITNDLAITDFLSHERRTVDLSADDVALPGGRLPTLAASQCSNHVGVDSLALTRHGHLVIVVQSVHNAQSPGLLAPSGSGSADWSDVETALAAGLGFVGFLRTAMARELAEECGLHTSKVRGSDTLILGFARFVHRGGKPQFFGMTPIDADENNLRRIRRERIYVTDHLIEPLDLSSPEALVLALRRLLVENQGRYSLPLYVNVELLARWVERGGADALTRLRLWAPEARDVSN